MKKYVLTGILAFVCFVGKSQYNKDIIIETVLKTDTTSIGQKIVYPDFQNDEISVVKVTIPPGKSTGWHKHNFPVFAYVLEGDLTIELKDGKPILFRKSSSFSEVITTNHNGINNGKDTVILIAFFMGEKGKPLSVHGDTQNTTIK
jgi:quercetin dioxygenase-like cupin family protein